MSERGHDAAGARRPPAPGGEQWSGERARRHIDSLELFGMRFGLDRMRRMMTALGAPQRRVPALHVLGTNGKSSTTRMIAAILQRHGLRTGAYLSPHLVSYAERVQIDERDLSGAEFAAAIARAAKAAERVNRTLQEDDHVTQFELLTAAGLSALAERGVEVAAIEAGLGGRFDATSVIESSVTVLTNVGLEHTRWLGPTIRDIATEKLAVLRPGTELVLGADPDPVVLELARALAAERDARLTIAPSRPRAAHAPHAAGSFQLRNFALAELAAERHLASIGRALQADAVRAAAAAVEVPGRAQLLAGQPPTMLDSAHNPHAVAALVRSLPELLPDRRIALVMGVLDDKDAAAMLRELLPRCERAWFTAPPSRRALPPAALQSLARQLGFEHAEGVARPLRALQQARAWASEHERGAVLLTGSVYLVGAVLAELEAAGG
ncbi:MAG: bifunctional folylpolyglutamate synthase/dihydrofolate synthase [Solirubrobacteraceae bacterium]